MDEGYARLPGAGYEALHPELQGVNPEDYPDIHKMAILADVAPYSREYHTFRQVVGKQAQGNTELEIEYEKILKRVKQTRSLRDAETKTLRARARPKPVPDPASLLTPRPFQRESKLGILESDFATRLAAALSKSNILAGVR